MPIRRVLVSGAGIAGLALAYWLRRHGFEPTVLEVAPAIRTGGYVIDFWGPGFEVAERMGLRDAIEQVRCPIEELEFVDAHGRVSCQLPVARVRELLGARYASLLRSDLERLLWEQARDQIETRFATSIQSLRADASGVTVELDRGAPERFDLVVGADGLRSNVRRLAFGADAAFERFLGYHVASFTVDDARGDRSVFRSHTVPDRQAAIYSAGVGRVTTFFAYRSPEPLGHVALDARKRALHEAFADVAWEVPALLSRIDEANDFYFDAVSQIRMPSWSQGRVALVGDAGYAVSLMAGEGAGLAMAGAYILASELARSPDDAAGALARYEQRLRPEIARKQRLAERFAGSFVPGSWLGLRLRDAAVRLMRFRPVLRFFMGRILSSELPIDAPVSAPSPAPSASTS